MMDPRPGRWKDVAALADLPEGQALRVDAGAFGAFLFRRGDQVSAVSSVCTHLPCELQWQGQRGVLLCPCHNQAFDSEGESMADPYPLPALPRVQVRVVDGRVQVFGT
jgi:nitrite reductase/ring-hydroxylating ferredoxin subunit